ncbi:asparagine synthase (glutamine-hydrolyzing) [Polyangium sorediatum]|uniref:asparagine synthase (glutamine-hydrolyzing) n=1 Tax=Polyangium sorediatum TaxID=889274 RepID=A0ABT6NPL2_9BACT|nr:asparagine synthase (glutamine-hydrolyzing) [Polyangium sorediatum]MDI1430270.1 asparagine synthase (glutamine-hydrolyzing) [Polyangium sorediatum]
MGAFSPQKPFDKLPFTTRNLDRIHHRGPDAQGFYVDDHAMLGFRRLAILDLAGGGQPLYSEDEQIVVLINGEIYNHHELRQRLADNHRFRSRVDGEVLVHLYEERGLDFVNELRGMFAFALYDRKRRRLVLGRDRAGQKPMFYQWSHGSLRFASEIKPLLQDGDKPAVSRAALAEYLRFGYVPSPRTILEGIHKLPAGSVLVADAGTTPRTIDYWKLRFSRDDGRTVPPREAEQWCKDLRSTLSSAVKMRLESEVPMGFLLSGGVDSASVFALGVGGLDKRRAQAFTIGFRGAPIDESEAAAEVTRRYEAKHRIIHLERSEATSLDEILHRVEEPVSTDALLPTACVFEAVSRAKVTTVLSGEGSDELFAGYTKFARATRDPELERVGPLERYLRHEEFVFTAEERATLLGEDIVDPRFDELEREARELDPLSQMLLLETRLRLPDRINLRLDRTSMAHSIEARAPFMDHGVMEFAATLPHAVRTGPNFNKHALRHAMRDALPEVVLSARKAPFHAPDTWFTDAGQDEALLGPDAIAEAGLVKPEPVQALRARARAGDRAAQERVFSLYVLHAWHRAFYRRLCA